MTAGGFKPLGQLNDRVVQRGTSKRLVLSAFVFMSNDVDPSNDAATKRSKHPHTLTIQPGEVADVWWADLDEISNTPVDSRCPKCFYLAFQPANRAHFIVLGSICQFAYYSSALM